MLCFFGLHACPAGIAHRQTRLLCHFALFQFLCASTILFWIFLVIFVVWLPFFPGLVSTNFIFRCCGIIIHNYGQMFRHSEVYHTLMLWILNFIHLSFEISMMAVPPSVVWLVLVLDGWHASNFSRSLSSPLSGQSFVFIIGLSIFVYKGASLLSIWLVIVFHICYAILSPSIHFAPWPLTNPLPNPHPLRKVEPPLKRRHPSREFIV